MASYKEFTKKVPSGEHFYLKIADIYRKMDCDEDAIALYRILVEHYDSLGMKDKALKVMALMAEMAPGKTELKKQITGLRHLTKLRDRVAGDNRPEEATFPQESFGENRKEACFDLGSELEMFEADGIRGSKEIETLEKAYGCEEIFKELKKTNGPSSVDSNFNYNMGVACREVGFIDGAIEQFKLSYERRQSTFEAAYSLGLCFKEKKMWEEARQAFEKALKVDGISQGKILAVKYELVFILKEQGKKEEALELLRKISAVDQ
jgi:tetratricopeptide (TPR) repeat protein